VDTPDLSGYNITRIALVYDVDRHPPNKVLRLASERVLGRGENHQSLRPDLDDRMRHENIVKRFQGEFVPPEGGLFEEEIRLSVVGSLEDNLKVAVEGLFPILGKGKEGMPSDKALKEALDSALGYKVGIVKPLAGEPSKPVRYYALSVEFELEEMARSALAAGSFSESRTDEQTMEELELEKRRQGLAFLDRLVDTGRIISKPHVTIVHEKTVADEVAIKEAEFHSRSDLMSREHGPAESMWKACVALEKLPTPTLFDFDATGLCWNDRVMTLIVGNLRPHQSADKSETLGRSQADADAASRVEEALCKTLVNVLHVTVGTGDETIPPYEARGLVEAWRAGTEVMEAGGRVRYIDLVGSSTLGRVVGMN
jgi:tRNA ligase